MGMRELIKYLLKILKKYWKGIRINSADMELSVGPLIKQNTSPCDSKTSFCANFNPFCPIEAGRPENFPYMENIIKFVTDSKKKKNVKL